MNSLILFIYIVGFAVSYFVIRHKWEDKPLSEQLWYAVAWPGLKKGWLKDHLFCGLDGLNGFCGLDRRE